MNIFGVGLPEMAVILVVGLLIFGPRKLPEIGRTVAKTIKSLQSASREFEAELRRETSNLEKSVAEPTKTASLAADTASEATDGDDSAEPEESEITATDDSAIGDSEASDSEDGAIATPDTELAEAETVTTAA